MKQVLLGLALFLMSATLALAQRTVTGKVTDDQGELLIGATVTSPGTSAGVVTDPTGMFRLSLPENATVLKVTYTGFPL